MSNFSPNKDIRELLKGVSAKDLRTLCSAITAYRNDAQPPLPPQIMKLDNKEVIQIMSTYGLIESAKNPETGQYDVVLNVHPSLGELKSRTLLGGVVVQVIDPSSVMNDIINKSKNEAGPKDPSTGQFPASPFDVITSNAIIQSAIEDKEKFDDAILQAWEDRTLITRIVEDEEGRKGVQYFVKDEDRTRRLQSEALKEAEKTGENIRVVDQYKLISPPITEIPYDKSMINGPTNNRTCASPTAEIAGNLVLTALFTQDLEDAAKSGQQGKVLAAEYGVVSIIKKISNFAGSFDYSNFEEGVERTWGGVNHSVKGYASTATSTFNYGVGLTYASNGLVKIFQGNTEEGKQDITTGLKYVTTEAATAPSVTWITEKIAQSIVPGRSLTGRTAFRKEELDAAIALAELEEDDEVIKKLKEIRPGKVNTKESAEAIEDILNEQNRAPVISRISSGLQVCITLGKYGPTVFGFEQARDTEKTIEAERTAIKDVGPDGQIGIYVDSGGTVKVDDNIVQAFNPKTGGIENINLPFVLCVPPIGVRDIGTITRVVPLDVVKPFIPTVQELTFGDKIKLKALDIQDAIYEGESKIPINILLTQAIATIITLLEGSVEILSGPTGKAAFKKAVEETLKKAGLFSLLNFAEILAHPLVTFALFLIQGGIPGDTVRLDILEEEYNELIKLLEEECTRGVDGLKTKSDEDCKKERQRIEEDFQKAKSRIRTYSEYNNKLPSVNQDQHLNSDVSLALEVETAKNDFDRFKNLLTSLNNIGDMLEQNTMGISVDLDKINQNVSFVTDPYNDPRPYQEQDGGGNSLIPVGCFPSYVPITTNDGTKKISEIKVDDVVISFNSLGELEEDIVVKTFIHENKEIYRYYLSNHSFIDITKEHPVLTLGNIFKEIGTLDVNDCLIDIDGSELKIVSIEFLKKDTVYNIEVKNNHTYIAKNIRVHNKTKEPIGRRPISPTNDVFILISSEFEDYWKEFLDWLDETFPGVLQDGWPLQQEYPEVPGVGPETTGGEEPTSDPPYPGPPEGGTPTPQEGPIAIEPGGALPNVPLEIIFNLPDPF